jgi:ubiquinone/menaquinone biosynthesis C-methylase UbiE
MLRIIILRQKKSQEVSNTLKMGFIPKSYFIRITKDVPVGEITLVSKNIRKTNLCITVNNFKDFKSNKENKIHYESIKNYFREKANNKNGFYGINWKFQHNKSQFKVWEICNSHLKKILHENPKISRVIDVGCGIGDFTINLASRYSQLEKIVGIDFIQEPIEIAINNGKKYDNINFIKTDLLDIPFEDKFFNILICINTIHHVHKDDFERAIKEFARVTDKYIILEIRNKKNIFNFWYKYISLPILYKNLPVVSFSILEINNMIKKYSFKLQSAEGRFSCNQFCWRLLLIYKRISV